MIVLKRILICAALLTTLLLCACGRTEEPETTLPDTTANAPEPGTVISYDFRLKELPDIGKYKTKAAACFYDAPLREFRTSDGYGALLPYSLGNQTAEYGAIGRSGFMTADGRIVTAPIYESVYGTEFGGKTVYFANRRVLDESPVKIPSWEEDEEGASAAYQSATDYYYQNVRHQIISADGSRCVTLPSEPRWFTDEATGLTLIWTSQYEGTGETDDYRCVSFPLYDTDLNLVAELGPQLRTSRNAEVCAVEKDRVVIRATRYEEPDYTADTDLLFFRDGQLERTLALGEDFPYRVAGGLILCEKRLCDEYGNTVYPLGDSHADAAYDPRGGCWYVYHTQQGKLVKLDRGGSVLAEARTSPSTAYYLVTLYDSGGKTYVVIPHSRDYENTDGYVVYDANLREICAIGGEGTEKTSFCGEYGDGPGVFLIASDGKTEIRDITGDLLAEAPFAYDGYNLNYGDGDRQLVFLYRDGAWCAVFSAEDRSVVALPLHGETVSYPEFFSRKLLTFIETVNNGGPDRESDWHYVILDVATGERLLENVPSFRAVTVNGKTYFNYLKNDTAYLCDEDLNVIAALYDDLFV